MLAAAFQLIGVGVNVLDGFEAFYLEAEVEVAGRREAEGFERGFRKELWTIAFKTQEQSLAVMVQEKIFRFLEARHEVD